MAEHEVRPWGMFEVLADDLDHKVKRITVNGGSRLSYQRHMQRAEHWFIIAGAGTVTLDDVPHSVGPGDAIDIPLRAAHRIENTGSSPLIFIEVQHGADFDEDDIERLEDDYGRVP